MNKKYIVRFTAKEREDLKNLTTKGKIRPIGLNMPTFYGRSMPMGRIGQTIKWLRLTNVIKIQLEMFASDLWSKARKWLLSVKSRTLHPAKGSSMERLRRD